MFDALGVEDMKAKSARVRGGFVSTALLAVVLAVVPALLAPDKSVWLLMSIACLAAAVLCPEYLCYALVPAITVDGVLVLRAGPLRVGPTDIIVGALSVGLLLHIVWPLLRTEQSREVSGRSHLVAAIRNYVARQPSALLIFATLAAYLAAIVLSGAVASSRTDVLKEVLKWAEVLVAFSAGLAFLAREQRMYTLVWIMLGFGILEALLGYGQWVLAAGDAGQGGLGLRVFGTFDQPNPYAAYLNFSLPLAIVVALFVRRGWLRWTGTGAAVLLLGAQVLANSRGALLGLLVAVAVLLIVAVGFERWATVIAVSGAVVFGLAWVTHLIPMALRDRLLSALRINGVSVNGPLNDANFSSVERLVHWVAGLRMFAAHPILGVGAGNYGVAYVQYEVPGWHLALGQAHDYYINAAAETGLIGLVAFLSLTVAMLVVAWRGARWQGKGIAALATAGAERQPSTAPGGGGLDRLQSATEGAVARIATVLIATTEDRALALGVLGVLVCIAAHNLVDDVFVHGMELQMALDVALVILLLGRITRSGAHTPVND